jgi:hypothetical protein
LHIADLFEVGMVGLDRNDIVGVKLGQAAAVLLDGILLGDYQGRW